MAAKGKPAGKAKPKSKGKGDWVPPWKKDDAGDKKPAAKKGCKKK
jgi:hypothetical protein